MKLGVLIGSVLFVIGALVALTQLWFSVWSPEMFSKILITLGVLLLVTIVLAFVFRDFADTEKLNDGGDL
jgi:hypothetical protein